MDIKNIDLDYLDMATSNFDITDSVNYNFKNYINLNNFVEFLKKEGVYDSIKETIDLYIRFYHKQDEEEIENYSNELQENVVNFFKESVCESIVESEDD